MLSFWLRKRRWTGIQYVLSVFVLTQAQAQAEIIVKHPDNITVCLGEKAKFRAESTLISGFGGWEINGTVPWERPPEVYNNWASRSWSSHDPRRQVYSLTASPPPSDPARFDGFRVRLMITLRNTPAIYSEPAYLSYYSNLQVFVTNLTTAISQAAIKIDWQPLSILHSVYYLLSIHNITDSEAPVPVPCNDCQSISSSHYDFYPKTNGTCDVYEIRVTAVECPEADHPVNQSLFSTIIAAYSGIAPVTAWFSGQHVLINWTPMENSSYRIVITHPDNGTRLYETDYDDTPPYYYSFTPEPCDDFDLNVAVTPSNCNTSTHEARVHIFTGCQTPSTTPFATPSTATASITVTIPSVTVSPPSGTDTETHRLTSSFMSGYKIPVLVTSSAALVLITVLASIRIVTWKTGKK